MISGLNLSQNEQNMYLKIFKIILDELSSLCYDKMNFGSRWKADKNHRKEYELQSNDLEINNRQDDSDMLCLLAGINRRTLLQAVSAVFAIVTH